MFNATSSHRKTNVVEEPVRSVKEKLIHSSCGADAAATDTCRASYVESYIVPQFFTSLLNTIVQGPCFRGNTTNRYWPGLSLSFPTHTVSEKVTTVGSLAPARHA